MSAIAGPTEIERRTAEAVRDEIRRRVGSDDEAFADVATKLGLAPVGLEGFLRRRWSFEQAFRVASTLGVDFAAVLKRVSHNDGTA